jgi:hypothetical protein
VLKVRILLAEEMQRILEGCKEREEELDPDIHGFVISRYEVDRVV